MQLHQREMELLAALSHDPAYMLLTEKIAFLIEGLTEELHHADATVTLTLLPYWRAMRTIYTELILTPTSLANLLKEHGVDMDEVTNDPKITNELATAYRRMAEVSDPDFPGNE